MGGFGSDAYGAIPWGGSEVIPTSPLIDAQAIAENCILLTFLEPIIFTGLENREDSSLVSKFRVVPVAGVVGLDEEVAVPVFPAMVTDVSPTQLAVYTDRPMSHYPIQYTVAAYSIYGTSGDMIAAVQYGLFYGVHAFAQKSVKENYQSTKDFSNPTTLSSLLDPVPDTSEFNLGTFNYGDDGDYAIDEGVENLKKRVIRRIITRVGGFVWLPGYGAGAATYGKRLNSLAVRERIRHDIEAQVVKEPDVAAARVLMKYVHGHPNVLWLYVRVKTKAGKGFQFDVPIMNKE